MKKLLLIIFVLISIRGMSQDFPGYNYQSSPNTRHTFLGALQSKKGFINGVYADTTAANSDWIEFHHGAQIWAGSNFYLRDSILNMWIKMAKSSDVTNIYNSNGILTSNRTLTGLNNTRSLTFDSLDYFSVNRNGVIRMYMSSTMSSLYSPSGVNSIIANNSYPYLNFNGGVNYLRVLDTTLLHTRASYEGNIHSTFYPYSLVDKSYVDSLVAAGGGIFIDNIFTIQDNLDASKELQFQLSAVSPSNVRTLTVPDASGIIALSDVSNNWANGIRQSFNPDGTNAGLNVGGNTGNPSSPADGDIFYEFGSNELRARINGAWVALGGGSGTNNANVGSGYRILKPSTQEIKTIHAGDGILIDSTSNTNEITITNTNVCGTGEVKEIVFDIGDYGYPQLYDNTYTRSAFADDVDVYRGGKLQKPNSASFGVVQNTGTETLTFAPIFTGLEQMIIRKKEGCFSDESLRPILLIANGESLMTGWGANSSDSATSTERAVRRMKNLNGDNLTFEVLNIGNDASDVDYNNNKGINRGGNESFARTHHGLELGFANKYDSLAFDGRPVYFSKCALGGTRILDWRRTAATHYFDTLMKYIDTSYSKIVQETGKEPIVFFLWEDGVNDQVAGMSASAWQDTVSAFFADVRSHLTVTGIDTTYILMTKLASPSLYTAYNTNMDNIQTADANGVTFAIATTGALHTCEDTNCRTHWGYTGMRNVVVGVLTTKIQELLTRYQ